MSGFRLWGGLALLLALPAGSHAGTLPELTGAWVRALPPTQSVTAAYLTVSNTGDTDLVVTGATADVAGAVEIHTSREVDGMLRMEQLQSLRIAAGEAVELAPGGAHLMLLDLERMPAPGQSVRLCLQLASGEEACTVAAVTKAAPSGDAVDHSHQH
ncbi:MAG: copper chaperone PCu(A)C [Halioglobus sp.]|nr:copper chaperone PCu(A)C [Halioglobus sp.]